MRLSDLAAFASAALGGHRLRSALSLAGVSIGVASVVLLTSLGEGARVYVVNQFTQLGTNLLVVFPGKNETTGAMPIFGGVPNDLTLEDAHAIRRAVPQVYRMAPLTMGEAEARFGDRARDVTVVGTTSELREIHSLRLNGGRYLPPGDPRQGEHVCVIGAKVQQDLFPDTNPLGEILHLSGERYRIIGVVAPHGSSLGLDADQIVAVPVSEALRMFNQHTLFRILVETGQHDQLAAAKKGILAVLTARHSEEDVTVMTQDAVLDAFEKILRVLTAAIAGIASISLTVAGVSIMNVMLVSVSERTSEIGLMKAVGATRRQVTGAFLLEASFLSGLGGVIGLALGYAGVIACRATWPKFPVQAPPWAVLAALVVSVAVGLAFGAIPASRAARLDPVQALSGRS